MSRIPPQPSELRRLASSEVRARLAEILEAVGEGGERLLIERRGKPPVALISVDDLLKLQMFEALRGRDASSRREGP
jgi:prevent-host-death family protein